MIFNILMWAVPVIVVCAVALEVTANGYGQGRGIFVGVIGLISTAIPVAATWVNHASDLSVVSSYSAVISVYEERTERLADMLAQVTPTGGALMNADTPVASIVASLTEAEEQLAGAKADQANAIVRIEARRRGPMSGVIGFVGGYKTP